MYEHRKQPLASKRRFIRRMLKNIFVALVLMAISLLIGVIGYRFTSGMSWIDALHNAAMILSGMGLIDRVDSDTGKIFSSVYALFSGVVFITNFGIILAPVLHRIYHRLHMDES